MGSPGQMPILSHPRKCSIGEPTYVFMLLPLLRLVRGAAFLIQFAALKIIPAYVYDAKWDGVWSSSWRSSIFWGASRCETVPDILYRVANENACTLLLFVSAGPYR